MYKYNKRVVELSIVEKSIIIFRIIEKSIYV